MSGDRQLVREAVAGYFGGTAGDPGQGIFYQNGPLNDLGLGTAYPYMVKGVPDPYYTAGQDAGAGFGAVLSVRLEETHITRRAMAGKTTGWRDRHYTAQCALDVLSRTPLLETAEAGLDDLVDGLLDLIYADRTLGTTSDVYPTGRLITQAGEGPEGIMIGAPAWTVDADRGPSRGGLAITFDVLTMVMS